MKWRIKRAGVQLPDTVRQLAQAAFDGAEPFWRAVQERKPNADTIAQALQLSLHEYPFTSHSTNREMLRDQLQIALTREHISAQERMGHSVTWLNWILIALTAALVWFAYIEHTQLNACGPACTSGDGPG